MGVTLVSKAGVVCKNVFGPSCKIVVIASVSQYVFIAMTFLGVVSLLLCLYAPWHDSFSLGQRALVSGLNEGGFAGASWAGVVNHAFILALSLPIAWRLLLAYRASRPRWFEALTFCLPVLAIVRLPALDRAGLVLTANLVMASLWILAIHRREQFAEEIRVLRRYGLPLLVASYALAIALPLLIPVRDYEIFREFRYIRRFRGWAGEGQPIGWGGLTLCAWGSLGLVRGRKSLGIVGIALGLLGIRLNVLRISLIASVALMAALSSQVFWAKRKAPGWVLASFAAVGIALFFTGEFKKKNTVGSVHAQEVTPRLSNIFSISSVGELDQVVITSGRATVYSYLLEQSRGSRVFGMGTGAAKRLMEARTDLFAIEPNSDFLRLLIDLGIVGLSLFLTIIGIVFWRFGLRSLASVIMGTFCVALLSDAFLLMPAIGYGPLFLALFSVERWTLERVT